MDAPVKEAFHFLSDHHVLSLAVCSDGQPHCCSLMYSHVGFTIFWVSDPAARHSLAIDAAASVRVSATVAPDYGDFRQIRGLQISGTASRVTELADPLWALALLGRRCGFPAGLADRPTELTSALARAKVYRLVPDTLTLIDNTRAFADKTTYHAAQLAAFVA